MTMKEPKHLYDESTKEGRKMNLEYRCNIANEVRGESILISIHANAFHDPNVSGYEVFYYEGSKKGKQLATCLHQAAKEFIGVGENIKDRGVKANRYYDIIEHTKMPAVITEAEFYTNKKAANKLKSYEFREKYTESLYQGIINYMKLEEE